MSLFKKICLGFLIVLLLLVGTVAFLIGTQTGLHLVISGAQRFVPGLNIASVEGGWRNLTLKGLHYEMPGVDVKDGEFRTGAQWQDRSLHLLPTHMGGLLIALPKTPVSPLPDVVQAAQDKVVEKATEKVTGKPAEKPVVVPEKPLGETLQELFAKPLLPELPDFRLPLELNIDQITADNLRLTGDTDVLITRFLLKASTLDQVVKLDALQVRSPQGSLDGIGQATLNGNWPVDMTINTALNVDPLKGEKIKLKVGGALREKLDVGLNLSGPVRAQLSLETRLAEAGLPLNLALESNALQWPLAGTPQFQAKGVKLKFSGKATDYALSLHSDFSGDQIPPATLTVDGKGNVEQFKLTLLRLAALQGNTDLTGVVDWSKAISWNTLLTLNNINTAKQYPDWPAKLQGKIATRGSLYGGSWQMQVPTLELDGNVKNNLVKARGNLRGIATAS